jgi:hypothetical protein
MGYRDDLEAAQQRIKDLENQVADLKEKNAPPPTTPIGAPPAKKVTKEKAKPGCIFGGIGGFALFVFVLVTSCTRACVACDSEVTDPALAALNKCPAVKEVLGEDIGWSMIGCSNYRGRSGGDPVNSGCHSSASYSMPVSGTKARGTYNFSSSAPPGQSNRFMGGSVWLPNGKYVSISADGKCQ